MCFSGRLGAESSGNVERNVENQAWGRRGKRDGRWRDLSEKGEQHIKDVTSGYTFLPGAGRNSPRTHCVKHGAHSGEKDTVCW